MEERWWRKDGVGQYQNRKGKVEKERHRRRGEKEKVEKQRKKMQVTATNLYVEENINYL